MITMEDNKRKFKVGDIVELKTDSSEFKKGSLFIVTSIATMQEYNMITVKSKLDNKEYLICNDYLKLYKIINEEFLDRYKPKFYFSTAYNKYNLLEKVMEDMEESNKKESNDTSTLSQVIDNLIKDLDKTKESKFNIKPMNRIIHKGLFKGQRCEIISEQDKTYTIRLLGDENSNAIKINKSDLYTQNEHEPEEGLYLGEYKYKIQGSKTILMDKGNNILVSTICNESDMFNKYRALEICKYKYLIKKYQKMIKSYQKELNILINE